MEMEILWKEEEAGSQLTGKNSPKLLKHPWQCFHVDIKMEKLQVSPLEHICIEGHSI